MLNSQTLALIGQLHDERQRVTTAQRLAVELGAEALLVFTPDPELGVLLPAPGFPQTLAPGRAWRTFLTSCAHAGRHSASLALHGRALPAYGAAAPDGSLLVLLGGQPRHELIDDVLLLVPLLSSAFARERAVIAASGHAAAARQAAESAVRLASALDTVRVDLQGALGRAQQALRERDAFVSVAAHELNTPLTALKGLAQVHRRRIARLNSIEPARVCAILDQIDAQATKVAQLVLQLLDLSRLESGQLPLKPAATDVVELVRGVVATAQAQTSEHTLRIAAPPVLVAHVDALRLEQVLSNVLGNAMKYSPAGGLIQVEVRSNGDVFRIVVTDEGLGIPDAQRELIFTRFHRAESTAHLSGLGIGLFVSRQIIDLHGGQIHAENRQDGNGSRFVITLPVNAVAPPSERQTATVPAPAMPAG